MRADTVLAPPLRRAALLCLAAGYVDAYGYVDLGGVFAANMTGNTVLLGISATRSQWAHSLPYALTLAAFFLGAMATAGLKRFLDRPHAALLAAAVLLVIAGQLGLRGDLALPLLAFAMGLQGAAINRFGGIPLQTVVVTSTLLNLADGCIHRAWGPPMLLHATAWLAYGAGAALAVLLSQRFGIPLVLPATALAVVAVDLAVDRRRAT